ncbi:MAG: DUF4270 family protein [Bacteroidales bacterium]
MIKFYQKTINKLLVCIVIFPLFFSSCIEADRTLGDNLIPDNQKLKVEVDTLNIPLSSNIPDSIQAISSSSLIFGYIKDPKFGLTKVSTASILLPASDSVKFGDNPIYQSSYLELNIDSNYNYDDNDEGKAQNLYVYRLKSDLDSTRVFNSSLTQDDFYPNPISLGSPVYYGGSSIKIYLDDTFGKDLLEYTQDDYDDAQDFVDKSKGLYITTDTPDNLETGGRLNFISLNTSFLYINYTNSAGKDTLEKYYFGTSYALNVSENDTSEELLGDETSPELNIDCFAGVKPYLSGEAFSQTMKDWIISKGYSDKTILLSRAYLKLPFTAPEDLDELDKYPSYIYPAHYQYASADSTKYFYSIEDLNTASYVGQIDRSSMNYICDITSFAQTILDKTLNIIEGDESDLDITDNMWIFPLKATTTSSSSSYYYSSSSTTTYSIDLTNYSHGTINGAGASNNTETGENLKPTLTLVYTLLDK